MAPTDPAPRHSDHRGLYVPCAAATRSPLELELLVRESLRGQHGDQGLTRCSFVVTAITIMTIYFLEVCCSCHGLH